jgi:outer membrane protein assembly factor BamD
MNRRFVLLVLATSFVALMPFRSPAPLVFTPGEGWSYERVGAEGSWKRARAAEQLEVAQKAFDEEDYGLALKAARHTVKTWPLSDSAPDAQYIVARCYEERRMDEKAFNEYQRIIEKFPKSENLQEALERQYVIANRYLDGQWFRFLNYIPLYPSMERTSVMFDKIVKNGPYSEVAPKAQMQVGTTREKQKKYPDAVKAYEKAADRYNDRPELAADAIYRAGLAWNKQARTAEYDQGAAGHAISTYTDFMTLYPDDKRIPEAEKQINLLRTEQARGNFEIARFYEKRKRWNGALIYYNEVLVRDPNSPHAPEARKRIEEIKRRLETASK